MFNYSNETEDAHDYSECRTNHGRSVSEAKRKMPDEKTLYDLSDLFKMLSDSTRLRILWTIEDGELCVCGIAELLGMSTSAVSHQLKTLRQAKLVKSRKEGKNVYYSLTDEHVRTILDMALEHMVE